MRTNASLCHERVAQSFLATRLSSRKLSAASFQHLITMSWLGGGKRRLLVAGPEAQLAEVRAQLAAIPAGYLAELRLDVKLDCTAAQCSTMLFGLDGGCKIREAKILSMQEILSAIESMPMRRAEVRRGR